MTNGFQSLYHVFQHQADSRGDEVAFVCGERKINYRDFLQNVDKLAEGLNAKGVSSGERVSILGQNSIEYLELLIASAKLGAIFFPLNWRLSPEELLQVISLADAKVLVVEIGFLAQLEDAVIDPETTLVTLGEAPPTGFVQFDSLYQSGDKVGPAASKDDPVAIISTAATEGLPRGSVLTHGNLLEISDLFTEFFSLSEKDNTLVIFPLFHISGLIGFMQTVALGGVTVLQPSFDPAGAAQAIDEYKVTQIGTFPPMLEMLLGAKEQVGASWDSLRACFGILNPPEVIQSFLSETKAEYWTGYGQTETTGIVTLFNAMEKPGSAGKVVSKLEMRIVNDLDEDMPVGEPGEIIARGSLIHAGYWRDDEATEYAARGGWHHTGDMGKVDAEGYLYYTGRKPEKELIKSGGENVYPAEVEYVIKNIEGVADVCVIGVPSEKWGEAVKAVVEVEAGASLDQAALVDAVVDKIASYKKPQFVDFVDSLPRTPAGEIDRQAVKTAHG